MDALYLAKYVLVQAEHFGSLLSNLRLQYILYLVQRDLLCKNQSYFDNWIQAQMSGPVIPDVYYEYCQYAGEPIKIRTLDNAELKFAYTLEERKTIQTVVDGCCNLNAYDLRALACVPCGAWERIYNNGQGNRHEIPIDLIKKEGLFGFV